ncbi:MAG: DUF3786 domain-containing protein [Thermodesulfobacteriota bacterium]
MAYETCSDVSQEIWNDLKNRDPQEIVNRTGARYEAGVYHLKFLDQTLILDPVRCQVAVGGATQAEPGFRLCLTALLYLLKIDPGLLGPAISPLELPGGATFFRGHHGLPSAPLEERFGRDVAGFVAAGKKLHGEVRPAGDATIALQVFPGLTVEIILWQADDEFPAQVSFTLPAHLDKFWFLDAVWGLLNLLAQEMLRAV